MEEKEKYKKLKKLYIMMFWIGIIGMLAMLAIVISVSIERDKLQEDIQAYKDAFVEENIEYFKFSVNMMMYSSEQLNQTPEEFNKDFIKWFAECLMEEDCEVIE